MHFSLSSLETIGPILVFRKPANEIFTATTVHVKTELQNSEL